MSMHSLCVFQGASVAKVRDYLNEYTGPDTTVTVLRDGEKFYLRVNPQTGEEGGIVNESHVCPGSPGC
jgi:hypothetical protein